MAWYIEYDFRQFGIGKPERKYMELDCPDKLGARKQALKQALQDIQQLDLQNPQLVWKEKIPNTKRRR
ncbi:MAG: hypothetical protein NTX82_00835 [Candidatus Parcubacteria bacterium]|nr:hypothetical protein [Candidatus Parcubacteria bacterium]